MDSTPPVQAAFDETVVFLKHFNDLDDPRQQGKVTYPLDEILLLCLFAVLAWISQTRADWGGKPGRCRAL